MAIPLAVMAAIAAAPAITKGIKGIKQKREAKRLKAEDFQYIPPALRQNLASQRNRARSARMPGQSVAERNIRQSTAGGLRAAGGGSLSDKIAAAQGLVANEQNALAGVGAQAAQFQIGEERQLQSFMGQQGQYEAAGQEKFERTKLGLQSAGDQNIFGSVSDLASVATMFGGGAGGAAGGASKMLGGGKSSGLSTPSFSGGRGINNSYDPSNPFKITQFNPNAFSQRFGNQGSGYNFINN